MPRNSRKHLRDHGRKRGQWQVRVVRELVGRLADARTLVELLKVVPDEETAALLVGHLRWPRVFCCPHCGSMRDPRMYRRFVYEHRCRDCNQATSLALFRHARLPLHAWVIAVWLIGCKRESARLLGRTLGVGYETAWSMAKRIKAALG